MHKRFPSYGVKNISLFYWITFFINGWFILPNWVFYFRQHIDQAQLGIVEGVAVLMGILMEVPSVVLADLLGKKNTIILGSIFQIISCLILINSTEFLHFLIGNITMFIGFSFQSGATEAFAYDSLKEQGKEAKYSDVIGKSSSITIAALLISTFTGGYLYSLAPQAPFYAWIVFLSMSVMLLLFTTEPRIDTIKFNIKNYLAHLKEGSMILFNSKLRNYLVPILTFAIFIKLYQGIVRQSAAAYFGYTGETFGYLFAAISIPAIYLSFKFGRIRAHFTDKSLILINLLGFLAAFFVASLTQSMIFGIAYYLIINAVENVVKPLTSSIINERIDSRHRATTLSTLALFSQIPYIVLVLFFGSMTDVVNLPGLFTLYSAVILLVTGYSYFFVKSTRRI